MSLYSQCTVRRRRQTLVARFVTANATDFKFATHVPLCDRYSETELCRHMIPGLATRGRNGKTQKKCDSSLNNGRSSLKMLWQVRL